MELLAIFMSELSLHTASICAGVWNVKELCLLSCFVVGNSLLVNNIFEPIW